MNGRHATPGLSKRFGDAVYSARMGNGLTQEHLAIVAETDRASISRIERGERGCSLDLAVRLAEVLDLDLSAVLLWPD